MEDPSSLLVDSNPLTDPLLPPHFRRAAKWESLDQDLILEADLDPRLRMAFTSLWQRQRQVFGYSLFGEMPWYPHELVEDHPDAHLGNLETLIVDEYQDLNPSELQLVEALSMRSVTIVAVGDDEQSIYSWRMAAPEGIRRFTSEYQDAVTRTLTLSRRVRANFRANWTRQIRQSLEDLEIPVRDIEAAIEPLNDPAARQTMATCRLLLDERDDLAWWTFLQLRRNCSGDYIRLVADSAFVRGIRFHERLKVMNEDPVDGTSMSRNAVLRAIVDIEQTIVQFAEVVDYATPTSIVHEIANHLGLDLGNGFLDLLDSVVTQLQDEMGKVTLMDVISRLEPSAKDLALTGEGIAFMRIDKSKGLTFDVTITMGVEEEVFSSDKPNEHEELRRLLYVAMTRARRACYLTMARNRAGDATAYSWPCAEMWGWVG